MVSQQLQGWTSDSVADASRQLHAMLNADAYDRLATVLR
jgi:hypothetical protein